jgi:hypothetical protein
MDAFTLNGSHCLAKKDQQVSNKKINRSAIKGPAGNKKAGGKRKDQQVCQAVYHPTRR